MHLARILLAALTACFFSIDLVADCKDFTWQIAKVRRLSPYDLNQVIHIENSSFQFPWSLADFRDSLREENRVGLIVEANGRILGYAIYSLYVDKIVIDNLAVHPLYRNEKIGTQLIERLQQKLKILGIPAISVTVRETNLPAQLFFKSVGFDYFKTIRKPYSQTPQEDAYQLEYWDKTPTHTYYVKDGRVEQPGHIQKLSDTELSQLFKRLVKE